MLKATVGCRCRLQAQFLPLVPFLSLLYWTTLFLPTTSTVHGPRQPGTLGWVGSCIPGSRQLHTNHQRGLCIARSTVGAVGARMEWGGGTINPATDSVGVGVLNIEEQLSRRVLNILRIPPARQYANVTLRPSPAGLARQEQREEERGLCKVNRYNPDVLRPGDMKGYFAASRRLAQVVTAVSALAFALLSTETTSSSKKVKADAIKVRETLTQMGATFVKVGQVLANRPDIVRADYMEELTKLQDQVPPFPSKQAFEIMEKSFGCPPSEIFDNITPEPLAAASLGQVYKATLKKNGKEVAIKVQRPGVAEVITRDIYLLRLIAKNFNDEAVKRIGVDAVTLLDEFAENLLEELDYNMEAENIKMFQKNFHGDITVKILDVYPELSSSKVLVMEWIDGVRCTDIQKIKEIGVPVKDFIRVGVDAQTRQLLEFGLFHGDPHPGNIFALRDGRIAYVDFGSVAEISQTDKETLVDCVVYAMDEDFFGIARAMTTMGFIAPGTDLAPIAVALEGMWRDAVGRDMRDFNLRTVTRFFSNLVYEYPIRVPERFALVIRTLLTQEGICLTLDPNFKLLEVAYPAIAKRLLRDPTYANRLPQVLLKNVPLSSKPVFDFGRLFMLLGMAASVAGSGNALKGLQALWGTAGDAFRLLYRKPMIAMDLFRGVMRFFRTKIYEGVYGVYRFVRTFTESFGTDAGPRQGSAKGGYARQGSARDLPTDLWRWLAREEMLKAFRKFDKDNSGLLDKNEIMSACELVGVRLKPDELVKLMKEIDSDNSGQVDFSEFEALVNSVRRYVI